MAQQPKDKQGNPVRFIRKGGKVIPIRAKNGGPGTKSKKTSKAGPGTKKKKMSKAEFGKQFAKKAGAFADKERKKRVVSTTVGGASLAAGLLVGASKKVGPKAGMASLALGTAGALASTVKASYHKKRERKGRAYQVAGKLYAAKHSKKRKK